MILWQRSDSSVVRGIEAAFRFHAVCDLQGGRKDPSVNTPTRVVIYRTNPSAFAF